MAGTSDAEAIRQAVEQFTRRLDEAARVQAVLGSPGLARMDARTAGALAAAQDDQAAFQARQVEAQRLARGGPDAFRGAAALSVARGLEGQERSLAGVRASADPAALREQVRLEQAIADATRDRAAAKAQMERAADTPERLAEQVRLEQEITRATKEREAEKKRLEQAPGYLQESLRLEQQSTALAKERQIAAAQYQARPEVAAENAALDRRLAEAQRAQGLARARAGGAESPLQTLGGAGMDVASRLPGGRLLGAASNVIRAATGEKASGLAGAFEGMGMIGAAAGPLGAITAAAPAAIDGLKGVAGMIVDLGGKASPGELQRFTMAMEDVQATIGRVAVPALELMTHGLQVFGDFMSTALPSREEVEEIMSPLHDVIEELKPALAEVAPVVKDFVEHQLKQLVFGIKMFAEAVKFAIEVFKYTPLGMLLGVGRGGTRELQDRDRAPRDAQFSAVDSYLKSQYQSVYRTGGTADPARQTADNTRRAADSLEAIARNTDPDGRAPARPRRNAGDVSEGVRRGVERGAS